MTIRFQALTAVAAALFASSAFAQTSFPEVEPNSTKAEATAVTGIVAGDSITGTSTGTTVTAGSTLITTVDQYLVKTGALALGIYEHRLTITSAVVGHTGTIRGLNQTGTVGVGGTAGTADTVIQTSSTTTTPPRFNQWYGFGKQEELYYRVTGAAATTAAYTSTMSTTPITATVIGPAFEASSPITITTVGQATADTDIHIYDGTLTAIAGLDCDDEFGTTSTQSKLIATFAPGTYYLAVGVFNTAWNIPAGTQEDFMTGALMDFPDVIVCNGTAAGDRDFLISACNGSVFQSNQVLATAPFSVQWFQFTVANAAPPISAPANDNCASAMAFNGSGSHTTKLSTATNDGAASCDPGGLASKDVWYSFNGGAAGGTLSVSTCGTTLDTVLSIHNTCGGADVLCNDDCGGSPCASTASCISGVVLAPSQVVLVRVSDKGLGGCGDVTTAFTFVPFPPPNDSCATPTAVVAGSTLINTTTATTGAEGQAEALCLFAGTSNIRKDVWFTYAATTNGTATVTTCGLLPGSPGQDSKIAIFSGAACPTTGTAIACWDDDAAACAASTLNTTLSWPTTCGTTYLIQLGGFSTTLALVGSFNLSETGTTCSTPSVVECAGDTPAMCPCSAAGGSGIPNPGAPGSGCANTFFPGGATLSSSGIAVDNPADSLVLSCSGMTGPGLFIQANSTPATLLNFNDGTACALGGILRMGVVFPTAGVGTFGAPTNPIHIAGAPVMTGGSPTPETKHYQVWYRDNPTFCNPAVSNMSNGLAIVWAP